MSQNEKQFSLTGVSLKSNFLSVPSADIPQHAGRFGRVGGLILLSISLTFPVSGGEKLQVPDLPKEPGGSVIIGLPSLPSGAKKLELVLVPGRGSVKPFFMGKYEVTQGQYGKWNVDKSGPNYPVESVSWNDAKEFCRRLTAGLPENLKGKAEFRLPTDAEWSVAVGLPEESGTTPAAKSGRIRDVYPWGTQWPPPSGAGKYDYRLKVDNFEGTAPVGSFKPNQYGLYDLGGNVSEWCEDWYDKDQKYRVARGASWCNSRRQSSLLSSYRDDFPPDDASYGYGFRLVLAIGETNFPVSGGEQLKLEVPDLPKEPGSSVVIGLPSLPSGAKRLELVLVPGRGSVKPFFMGKYEVTQGQYETLRENRSGNKSGPDYPVDAVNWGDAKEFCRRLTAGLPENLKGKAEFRLPTDAEWSVAVGLPEESGTTPAAKSGRIRDVYPWGTQWPPPSGAGNYRFESEVDNFVRAAPVGNFKPNQYGLYDLGGNVWEWCEDWGGNDHKDRVLRGASFIDFRQDDVLSSTRSGEPDSYYGSGFYNVGFRVVLGVGETSP